MDYTLEQISEVAFVRVVGTKVYFVDLFEVYGVTYKMKNNRLVSAKLDGESMGLFPASTLIQSLKSPSARYYYDLTTGMFDGKGLTYDIYERLNGVIYKRIFNKEMERRIAQYAA